MDNPTLEANNLGIVANNDPEPVGGRNRRHHEATVIGLGVFEHTAGEESVQFELGHELSSAPAADQPGPAVPKARKRRIGDQSAPDLHRLLESAIDRHYELQRPDQVGRDPVEQSPPFPVAFANQADVAHRQVAEAAVDQLRRRL